MVPEKNSAKTQPQLEFKKTLSDSDDVKSALDDIDLFERIFQLSTQDWTLGERIHGKLIQKRSFTNLLCRRQVCLFELIVQEEAQDQPQTQTKCQAWSFWKREQSQEFVTRKIKFNILDENAQARQRAQIDVGKFKKVPTKDLVAKMMEE